MTFKNANIVTDYEPSEFQHSEEIEKLDLIQQKEKETQMVIVTIPKPKPKIVSFVEIIIHLKEYFSDPMIREELIENIVNKVKEAHPKINTKLIMKTVRVAILPMISIMIIAVNQIQYHI